MSNAGRVDNVAETAPARVQNFHAPVGTVANAETIHIHTTLGLAPSGPAPERASLAPTLIDRRMQADPLLERLEEAAENGQTALLVVVPGCIPDLHSAFVLRCARIDFAADPERVWLYLRQLRWPEGASSIDAILKTIRDGASLGKALRRPEIETALRNFDRSLCFGHLVDGSTWEEDNGALVRAWVDYFCSGAMKPAGDKLCVAFLSLALKDPRSATCAAMEAFIQELKNRQGEGEPIHVTPLLGHIRHKHLSDWVGEASTFLADDLIEAELVDLPATLFPDPYKTLPFQTVFDAAQAELARAIRKYQPKFVETET